MSKKSLKPWKHFSQKHFSWTIHSYSWFFGKNILPKTLYLLRWCVFCIFSVPGIFINQLSLFSTKSKPKCISKNTGQFLNHSVFFRVFKVFSKLILKLLQCPAISELANRSDRSRSQWCLPFWNSLKKRPFQPVESVF